MHSLKNSFTHNLKDKSIFFVLFVINFYLIFPGCMTPDSAYQYQQAITGEYAQHHPPVMAFWWRMMLNIYNSSTSMLVFHLVLLWSSSYHFYKATKPFDGKHFKWSLLYFIIPFCSWMLSYSAMIWKDVSFAYSCLFAASVLTRASLTQEKLKPFQILMVILALFYGTAAKYVGMFVLPILALWLTNLIIKNKNFIKVSLSTILITALILLGQVGLEKLLVKSEGQTFSWQYVKLYDLAGISLNQNKMLFPDYILNDSEFSDSMIKQRYNSRDMVPLFGEGENRPRLHETKNLQDLDTLWDYWFNTVKQYPLSYLKHRLAICKNLLNNTNFPLGLDRRDFLGQAMPDFIEKFKFLTKFKYWALFVPFYIVLGIAAQRRLKDNRGSSLIYMHTAGTWLFLVLLQFSMSSDSRFLLMSLAMITFSHPIAMGCIYDLYKRKKK